MDSSKLKDLIVTLLIEESSKVGNRFTFDAGATPIKESTSNDIERVLHSLAQDGFIKCDDLLENNYFITLNQSIFDLKERGGFSMQLEILKLRFEKLQIEVEKLEEVDFEKNSMKISTFRDITGILSSLINIVSTIADSYK